MAERARLNTVTLRRNCRGFLFLGLASDDGMPVPGTVVIAIATLRRCHSRIESSLAMKQKQAWAKTQDEIPVATVRRQDWRQTDLILRYHPSRNLSRAKLS